MTWFRSDDDLPEHPKSDVLEQVCPAWADLAAAWMTWHHMGCDCARRRTDGAFARSRAHRAVRLPPAVVDAALAHLTAAGFLDADGDAFQFHDWQDYQPVKAELDAERRAKTARQNRWRQNARKARLAAAGVDGGVDASTDAPVDGAVDTPVDASTAPSRDASTRRSTGTSTDASTRASRAASPPPSRVDGAPTRPVPSRPPAESETSSPPAADDAGASPAAPEGRQAASGAAVVRGRATKARKVDPTDSLPLEPGSGPAKALAALRASPTLAAIVARPNALCAAIGADAYPAVDVPREIRAAEAWLVANPKNRKSDGARFLTNWLSNAQNRAPRVETRPVSGPDDWEKALEAERRRIEAAKGGRCG